MTGEDRKNYRSIVSRMWKEIKEDPERLSEYNDRARQMKNEAAEKSDKVERPVVKSTKKPPKTPEFVDTDLDDSDTEDEEGKGYISNSRRHQKPQSLLIQTQILRLKKKVVAQKQPPHKVSKPEPKKIAKQKSKRIAKSEPLPMAKNSRLQKYQNQNLKK